MNRFFKKFLLAVMLTLISQTAYGAEVIPSGECIGVKLYTDGLIVCDTAVVTDSSGAKFDIAKGYDIKKGDVILRANGRELGSNEELMRSLSQCSGEITLTVKRGNDEHDITVNPAQTADGPKLGLWLRDSTAGVGTLTCYINGSFAALGHGIYDIDTGNIMSVGRGIIQEVSRASIIKSRNGAPGAITGNINGAKLGEITANSENGLFGTAAPPDDESMETAKPSEIKTGEASILADVDGKGVKEYSIEIKRIFAAGNGRDMVIKITDKSLIEKTGGIVQGMSGAPIIQNGKLVGAITHVFVNDPLSGYAIFADNLLKGL